MQLSLKAHQWQPLLDRVEKRLAATFRPKSSHHARSTRCRVFSQRRETLPAFAQPSYECVLLIAQLLVRPCLHVVRAHVGSPLFHFRKLSQYYYYSVSVRILALAAAFVTTSTRDPCWHGVWHQLLKENRLFRGARRLPKRIKSIDYKCARRTLRTRRRQEWISTHFCLLKRHHCQNLKHHYRSHLNLLTDMRLELGPALSDQPLPRPHSVILPYPPQAFRNTF